MTVDRLKAALRRRSTSRGRPQVSVVVPLGGGEQAARASLDSVVAQQLAELEIVVAAAPLLRPLAERAAAQDPRVVLLATDVDDPAALRRTGAAAARAPRLLVLPPGQVLLPGALPPMLTAPSDEVVVGGLAGDDASWVRTPLLGRLLTPRELWVDLDDAGDHDGQDVTVRLLRAGPHLLGQATVRDTAETSRATFLRLEDPFPELPRRVASDEAMLGLLPAVLAGDRAAGSLTRDLPRYLLASEMADAGAWEALHRHAALLVDAAGEDGLDDVPVEDRVAAWLAAQGRRHDLVALVAARRGSDGQVVTHVEDGEVYAADGTLPADVPRRLLRLGPRETRLRAQVRRTRLVAGAVEVELMTAISSLDQGVELPLARVRLRRGESVLHLPAVQRTDAAVTRWMGERHQRHDGGVIVLRVRPEDLRAGELELELELTHDGVRRTGGVTGIDRHGSAAATLRVGDRSARWVTRDGAMRWLVADAPGPAARRPVVVRSVELLPGHVALRLDAPPEAEVALVAGHTRLSGVRHDDHNWTVALTSDPWGLGVGPAPSGLYRLVVTAAGQERAVGLDDPVNDLLPAVTLDPLHRFSVWRGPHGGLLLRLGPSLADEESGPWAQHRLQRAYEAAETPLDPQLVYFQSFSGQSPTDHPAALQRELHRRATESGLDVRMLWGVADSSVAAPEGAEAVLMRSREWYAALARAAYVVTNAELEPWFVRRQGQQVLATYHGYPSKAMGLGQWRSKGYPPTLQRQLLERTSGSWNTLLTPIPETDRYYRENYAFDGRIISEGYPRDDDLVDPEAAARREVVRQRLGIAAEQRVVLYAPTWRDDLATRPRRAELVLHLDVERAVARLGPDYLLLLRGHRFHGALGEGTQLRDVTGYPEINDLILAADAAVLDYSSLRFDFALTGRPMVFLVPDLAEYTHDTRGFLYPFDESAPGPLVETTDQVCDLLSDLPDLTERWAPRIAAFNATYNRLADGRAAERVVAAFFGPLLRA